LKALLPEKTGIHAKMRGYLTPGLTKQWLKTVALPRKLGRKRRKHTSTLSIGRNLSTQYQPDGMHGHDNIDSICMIIEKEILWIRF